MYTRLLEKNSITYVRHIGLVLLLLAGMQVEGSGRECSMNGRESCDRAGRDSVCLGSSDCSRDSNWGCAVSCGNGNGGGGSHGDFSGGMGSSGNGGNHGGGGSTVATVGLSGAGLAVATQELRTQVLSERYVTPSGKVCTKAEVKAAAQELAGVIVDALKDKEPSLILKGLIAPFFKEKLVDLDCAFAKRKADEIQQAAQEIENEITERTLSLSQPARLNKVLLSTATTIHGGIYNLNPAEREGLVRQFGGERWLVRAIELASKRCALNGRMHFCYADNSGSPLIIAQFDAMTPAQLNAWQNSVHEFIQKERRSGAL